MLYLLNLKTILLYQTFERWILSNNFVPNNKKAVNFCFKKRRSHKKNGVIETIFYKILFKTSFT